MTPPFPLPDTLSQVDALADARHADHDAARRALRTSPFDTTTTLSSAAATAASASNASSDVSPSSIAATATTSAAGDAAAGEIEEEEEAGAAAFARILRKNAGAVWEPQSRWLEVG